jgi:hypothetical protein
MSPQVDSSDSSRSDECCSVEWRSCDPAECDSPRIRSDLKAMTRWLLLIALIAVSSAALIFIWIQFGQRAGRKALIAAPVLLLTGVFIVAIAA